MTRSDDLVEFGELTLILIKDETVVHFLMRIFAADFLPQYHLHALNKETERIQCININDLLDFYPLTSYIINGHQAAPLKHSVLSH